MNHQTVIRRFAEGKNYVGSRIFAEGNRLYSYGRHFTLAIHRREAESNKKDGKDWFLLNGDKYSVSTSKHQGYTYHTFHNFPRVAFSAIHAAGIDESRCNVIDWTNDKNGSVHISDDPILFANFKKTMPIGAEYHERKKKTGEVYYKYYHLIGACVLEQDGKHYLCGMDEGSYFVSLLPKKVKSIDQAYQALKPEIVKKMENELQANVLRQGEWFFFPSYHPGKQWKKAEKSAALPSVDSSSNRHVCTRLLKMDNCYFVSGIVRHKNSFNNRRADHKPVKLGDGKKDIYQAVCNTAKGNWSANGRVD